MCTNVHKFTQLWKNRAPSILYVFQNWVMDKREAIGEFTTRKVKIGCNTITCYIYKDIMFVEKRENVRKFTQLWMDTAPSILYVFQNWVMDKREAISELTTAKQQGSY